MYDPGGGSVTLNVMYKVPLQQTENELTTVAMLILKKVEPEIPVYPSGKEKKEKHIKHRAADTFNKFFIILQKKVEEMTAADE